MMHFLKKILKNIEFPEIYLQIAKIVYIHLKNSSVIKNFLKEGKNNWQKKHKILVL